MFSRPCDFDSPSFNRRSVLWALWACSRCPLLLPRPRSSRTCGRAPCPCRAASPDFRSAPRRPGRARATATCPCSCWATPAGWTALVGIPLAAQPGVAHLSVRQAEGGAARDIAYTIAPKRYREQRLTVAPGTVDLSPEDNARYERERAHLAAVMATFTEPPPPALRHARADAGPPLQLLRPAPRLQRPAAQSAQRHGHRRAGTGTPVVAPLAGPRDRHRRLLLQRQHGLARPWRRPADDGTAT